MSRWQSLNKRKECTDAACSLPAGFFRLRYFHGKQMRLADYVDEQRYHAGKMRFHNEKLHGAGILCGLKVALLDPGGLVLRVGRGAASDDCGREIVVGFDQGVDVDAWFRAQKFQYKDSDDDPCKPDEERKVRICVVMRYRECAGAPEPAPATPCGPVGGCGCGCGDDCGCGGCTSDPCGEAAEFGRITEEFELRLMFWSEAEAASHHDLFPTADAISAAVAEATGGIALLKALAKPIRKGCPSPEDGWLLLACFDAVLDDDDDKKIIEIRDIDYDCASQVLLSTEVIQYLLAALYGAIDTDISGPEIADIAFRKLSANRYQFVLTLTAPIEAASLDADDSFNLRRLSSAGWRPPDSNTATATYATSAGGDYNVEGPAIYVAVDNGAGFLTDGARYQLYIPSGGEPVVDAKLRQLRPRNLAWRFTLGTDAGSGDLIMLPLS